MNKSKLLEGAYYVDEPSFAQVDEVFNYINEDGSIIKDNLTKRQIEYLEKLCEEFRTKYEEHSKKEKVNIESNINKLLECFYKEFDLNDREKPKISIVDKFPEPFSDRNYKAMTFNYFGAKKFNVPEGIYILDKYAIHGICEIMIAHEVMHYILREFTPFEEQTEQAPFYEEGIVDFMSMYLLIKYDIVDIKCVRNWLLFGRSLCTEKYIGSLYFKENKQIQYIARTYGIDCIKNIIREGLGKVKNTRILDINWKHYNREDRILNKLLQIYDYLFACFALSLDEYILYKSTLSKIIKVSDVNIEGIDLDNTINSLEKKGLIYILDDILYNPNNCILDGIKIIINY